MNVGARRGFNCILGLTFFVCATLLWLELSRDYALPSATVAAATSTLGLSTADPGDPDYPALTRFAAVTDRPLFVADRRAFVAPVSAPEPVQTGDDWSVSAIVITGTQRLALIRKKGDNKTYKVAEGDAVGGWKVAAVERGKISLRRGEVSKELQIKLKQVSR